MNRTDAAHKGEKHRMRQSVAAFALFRQQTADRVLWLAQWNSSWKRFNFVGGHKWENETFRECVVREIHEETGLEDGIHITVDSEPIARREYSAWSQSAQQETKYTIDLFWAHLRSSEAEQMIAADFHNRWLTESEIRSQQTSDGKAVSETMWMVLSETGLAEYVPPVSGNELPNGKKNHE